MQWLYYEDTDISSATPGLNGVYDFNCITKIADLNENISYFLPQWLVKISEIATKRT